MLNYFIKLPINLNWHLFINLKMLCIELNIVVFSEMLLILIFYIVNHLNLGAL